MMTQSLPEKHTTPEMPDSYYRFEALTPTRLLFLAQQVLGMGTIFYASVSDDLLRVLEVLHVPGSAAVCQLTGPVDVPLKDSFCQFVYRSGQPLIVPDAQHTAPFADLPTTRDLQIGAYVGIPLIQDDGAIVGTLCGIHPTAVDLTSDQVRSLHLIAQALIHTIEQAEIIAHLESISAPSQPLQPEPADRFAFDCLSQAALMRAAEQARPLSLLLVHAAGDETAVATSLSALGRVFHFDDSTLALLLPALGHAAAHTRLAQLSLPSEVRGGLADYPALAANLPDLVMRAQSALQSATPPDGNAIQLWHPGLAAAAA